MKEVEAKEVAKEITAGINETIIPRLDRIQGLLLSLDNRFSSLESRFDAVEARQNSFEKRMNQNEGRVSGLEQREAMTIGSA